MGHLGRAGLFALRPHLPRIRRANQGTRRRAHRRQSSWRSGLRHRLARQRRQESPTPLRHCCRRHADRRVGPGRRRARDHGKRHLLRRPRPLQRRSRDKFGIHFNSVLRKHVIGTQLGAGQESPSTATGPIFHTPAHHLCQRCLHHLGQRPCALGARRR